MFTSATLHSTCLPTMRFSEEEHRLAAETSIKYRGTACIELEVLTFAYEADEENVMILKKFFKKNGCNRLDVRNHVPAVISQEQLDITIRYSKTTAKALMEVTPFFIRRSVFLAFFGETRMSQQP